MANKYSKYQLKPYVSQYVDPGWVDATTTLRDRWDKNKAEHTKLQQLAAATQVGPNAHEQQIKQNAINDIAGRFDNVIKTNSYETADLIVDDAANAFLSNEPLKAAAQSYQFWMQGEKTKQEMLARGENPLFAKETLKDENGDVVYDENNQPVWVDPFENHKSFYVDEKGNKKINVYRPSFQKQLPWDEKMAEIVKDIGSSPVLLDRYDISPGELSGYLIHGNTVDDESIEKITRMLHDTYLTTDHGRQQLMYLTQESINPESGNHFTPEEAQREILHQLHATALKQKTTEYNYLNDKHWDWMMKLKLEALKNQTSSTTSTPGQVQPGTVKRGFKEGVDPTTIFDVIGVNGWDDPTSKNFAKLENKTRVVTQHGRTEDKILTTTWFDDNGNWMFDGIDGTELMTAENMDEIIGKYKAKFDAQLKNSGSANEQDMMDAKWMRDNLDLWVAKTIMENKDAYFHIKNRDKNNTDKDFLEMIAASMESIKNRQKTMVTVSNSYSDYMTEQISNGTYHNGHQWMFNGSNSFDSFVDNVAEAYKRGGGGENKGSGSSRRNTKQAIRDALLDPKNLSVAGFALSGTEAGTYVVQLNVPGKANNPNSQINNSFQVQFEIESVKELQSIFQDGHNIMNKLSKGDFGGVDTFRWGQNDDKQTTTFADVSYVYDTKTNRMEPKVNLRVYANEDLDLNGEPKEKATPQKTNEFVGQEWLEGMLDANLQTLQYGPFSNLYEGMITGSTSKGVLDKN